MIVSIGEALIDFIYQEQSDSAVYRPVPGGSPMNTSVALARLDVPVSFLSSISRDMFGKTLIDHLRSNQVGTDTIVYSDGPTTLAFAKISGGAAEYAFYSNSSADRSITREQMIEAVSRIPKAPFCYQIGSISLLLEPGASEIASFIANRPEGTLVSFDPNIRPSLVIDREAYLARLMALFADSDIVKISDEDLTWIFPETALPEAAAKILEEGPAVCVVTAGKHGVHWFSPAVRQFLKARSITIADTIGAGDTFHAGLLAYLYWSDKLQRSHIEAIDENEALEVLKYASMAAEINCTRQGADPPRTAELARELISIYSMDISGWQ